VEERAGERRRIFLKPFLFLKSAEVFSLAPGFSPVAADVKSDKPFQRLFFFLPAMSRKKPLKRFYFTGFTTPG
jgi:hypothetical protein